MSNLSRTTWRGVYNSINARILDGTYPAGHHLPRDEDLAAEFNCARSTVHRAMQELATRGTVERKRKGGTRVQTLPVTRATLDIPITRLEIENSGFRYDYLLIDCSLAICPSSIAAKMHLPETQKMLRVKALHLANGRPYVFEDRWVSLKTVPEIMEVDLKLNSANEWLVMNRPVDHFNIEFFAKNTDRYEAEVLEAPNDTAILVIERTTWSGGAPVTSVTAATAPGYRMASSTTVNMTQI